MKLRREAPCYSDSYWFPEVKPGTWVAGRRSENLERLTFPDASFDLFITQDVLEHIFDAQAAFREVARVLRPGGAHIFTVPFWPQQATLVRAKQHNDETIEHVCKPIYHVDPVDPGGTLVVRDWGNDIATIIEGACSLQTEIYDPQDRHFGLEGDFQQVFVTRKPG